MFGCFFLPSHQHIQAGNYFLEEHCFFVLEEFQRNAKRSTGAVLALIINFRLLWGFFFLFVIHFYMYTHVCKCKDDAME